jgi:hypothetical protein
MDPTVGRRGPAFSIDAGAGFGLTGREYRLGEASGSEEIQIGLVPDATASLRHEEQ